LVGVDVLECFLDGFAVVVGRRDVLGRLAQPGFEQFDGFCELPVAG